VFADPLLWLRELAGLAPLSPPLLPLPLPPATRLYLGSAAQAGDSETRLVGGFFRHACRGATPGNVRARLGVQQYWLSGQ